VATNDTLITPEIFIVGHIATGRFASYGINFLKQSAATGNAHR